MDVTISSLSVGVKQPTRDTRGSVTYASSRAHLLFFIPTVCLTLATDGSSFLAIRACLAPQFRARDSNRRRPRLLRMPQHSVLSGRHEGGIVAAGAPEYNLALPALHFAAGRTQNGELPLAAGRHPNHLRASYRILQVRDRNPDRI
jgi:hypothetical protein